jgi:hypothetical protein
MDFLMAEYLESNLVLQKEFQMVALTVQYWVSWLAEPLELTWGLLMVTKMV